MHMSSNRDQESVDEEDLGERCGESQGHIHDVAHLRQGHLPWDAAAIFAKISLPRPTGNVDLAPAAEVVLGQLVGLLCKLAIRST